MNRRALLCTLGTGISAGIAGCSALGSEGTVVEAEITIDPGDGELSEADFRTAVDDSHETYGPGGVWGRTETEPAHELDFQGAWTTTLGGSGDGRSDHLLALYRLPPAPNGTESSQVWLWGGATPAEAEPVRRITAGMSLPADGTSLGIYSPAQDYRASDAESYPVESGRLDAATLAATVPLSGGTIGVGEETRVGDGGAYHPYWEGDSSSARSLVATTEVRWAGTDDRQLIWNPAVETES